MKNTIKTLGLAALIGISCAGCSEDKVMKTYNIYGENFEQQMGYFADSHKSSKISYQVHSQSTHVEYPTRMARPLPRAEVTQYESGKITADLYYPVK